MDRRARIRQLGVYGFYILALAMIQVSWPRGWFLNGARPDLMLVVCVLSGFLFGLGDGIAVGLLTGYLCDVLAGRVIGMGMLLMMYAGLCGALMLRRRFRRQMIFALTLVGIVTVLYAVVIFCLNQFFPMITDVVPQMRPLLLRSLYSGLGSLILNTISAIPILLLLHHLGPYQKGRVDGSDSEMLTGDQIWRTN
jgi:rod shape-determining protein MreD